MSESIPKEIIGIAYASEWDHIKQFIKALLEMTLNSEEHYSLIVLNAIINNKSYEEYDVQIKSKAQIKLLSSITNFEKISLYQYSKYRRNIINISKDKNVIVLTAQYMGPEIDHTNYFDFAIYLNSFDLPYFSDNKGNLFECHEIMEIMRRFKPKESKKVKKPKPPKKQETFKSEIGTYKRITTRNAIWDGRETKAFQKWKMSVHKEFREKIGGFPFYKGKVTKKYKLYLNKLITKSVSKQAPPKKSKAKKPIVKKPNTQNLAAKKKSPAKKLETFKSEIGTYKKLTTRNAIWSGSETKAFRKWKMSIHKEFRENIGGKPYYQGKITKKYELYLNKLIIKSVSKQAPPKKSKAKKPIVRKPIVKKPITKNLAATQKSPAKKLKPFNFETKIYRNLTGKTAIWGGSETKAFQKWKLSALKEFREKIGGKPYYKGKITKKYELYLKSY